jgi:hypothetical protein
VRKVPVRTLQAPARADVGDTWVAWFFVLDDDDVPATATTTGTAVLPSGSTVALTVSTPSLGLYRAEFDTTVTGRHTITVTFASTDFGDELVTFALSVSALATDLPGLDEVVAYLGEDLSASLTEVADALAAEIAAQAARCAIPAAYPDDLAQALKRRVSRNLAARAVPVATFTSFEGGATSTRVPQLDAEITRFEAPWRRRPVG